MSKTTKVVLIVTGVFLVCVIGAGIIVGVVAGEGGFQAFFGGERFEIDEAEALDLAGVDNIRVECSSAEIHIVESDEAKVTLKGTAVSSKEQEEFLHVYKQDGTLHIKVDYKFRLFVIYDHLDLNVYLPGGDALSANVVCTSGDIRVNDLEFRELEFSRSSGDLTVSGCRADKLISGSSSGDTKIESCEFGGIDIESTSGGIDISGTPGSVYIRCTSGGIDIKDADGAVDIESTSGGVAIDMARSEIGPVKVGVTSGSILLYVFPDTAFDIKAKTSSGSIKSDMDIEVSGTLSEAFSSEDITGKCNGGGPVVDLSTSSGSIRVMTK